MFASSDDPVAAVREALAADAPRIASLAGQLGYEVPVTHVQRLIGEAAPNRQLFVAVVARAGVVGWVGVRLRETLTAQTRGEIDGLVVDEEYRGAKIGRALLARAERWAHERGCRRVRVLANVLRERAHAFYLREQYHSPKDQRVFEKTL